MVKLTGHTPAVATAAKVTAPVVWLTAWQISPTARAALKAAEGAEPPATSRATVAHLSTAIAAESSAAAALLAIATFRMFWVFVDRDIADPFG